MANTPRKMQDPTEAALSAIQDALNLRESGAPAPAEPAPDPIEAPLENRRRHSAPPVEENSFFGEAQAPELAPLPDDQVMSRPAANDDRQPIGQALQSLQSKPSRTPYLAA